MLSLLTAIRILLLSSNLLPHNVLQEENWKGKIAANRLGHNWISFWTIRIHPSHTQSTQHLQSWPSVAITSYFPVKTLYPAMTLQLHKAFLIRFSTLLHMRSLVQTSLHTEKVRIVIQQFSVHVSMEKRKILFYKENNLKHFKVFVCSVVLLLLVVFLKGFSPHPHMSIAWSGIISIRKLNVLQGTQKEVKEMLGHRQMAIRSYLVTPFHRLSADVIPTL